MLHWFIAYAVCLVVFLVIDAAWITLVARKLYDVEAGDVLRDKPHIFPSVLFYLLYAAGVVVFAVYPLEQHFNGVHAVLVTYRDAAVWSAGLGLFAYATFAFTNQAIIKQWKYKLAVADLLWGAVVTGIVGLIGFVVIRALS